MIRIASRLKAHSKQRATVTLISGNNTVEKQNSQSTGSKPVAQSMRLHRKCGHPLSSFVTANAGTIRRQKKNTNTKANTKYVVCRPTHKVVTERRCVFKDDRVVWRARLDAELRRHIEQRQHNVVLIRCRCRRRVEWSRCRLRCDCRLIRRLCCCGRRRRRRQRHERRCRCRGCRSCH